MAYKYIPLNTNDYIIGVVLLWFLRMVLPGTKFVFIPAFIVYSGFFFYRNKKHLFKKNLIVEFLNAFTPLLILLFFFIIGITLGSIGDINTRVLKDGFEFFIAFILLFIYFISIHKQQNKNYIRIVFKQLVGLISISSLIVALLGFVKFTFQLKDIPLPIETPLGTSLNTDKNFFALFSFLGIIGFLQQLKEKQSQLKSFFLQLIIIVLVANILFSFSYRGIIILGILLVGFVSIYLVSLIKLKSPSLTNLRNNTSWILIFSFALGISLYLNSNNGVLFHLNHHLNIFFNNSVNLLSDAFHFNKWQFAYNYFSDLPLEKKLFGDGFNYLQVFGQHYNGDAVKVDYPHNPIISAFLYSGLLGGLFALLFLIISVYYAGLYFRKYPLFASMLFVSLLFVFFSGNSLFSVPVFLFLFSFSFLIRYQEISDLQIDANLEKPASKLIKELFDYVTASLMFIVLLPILFVISILVLMSLGWPIFYSQTRIGQNGKLFRLHKFRTMKKVKSNTSVAAVESYRISKLGAVLRRTKLDELPELLNIIRGDMSFVGTRPDVPGYADRLKGDDKIILKLKPGLTGPASLKYINEEELLSKQENPQEYNDKIIWPDKVRINKEYYRNWNFLIDIKIIIYTIFKKQL